MNYLKSKDREAVKKAIDEGRRHLNFMVSFYRKQQLAGRHFLHEHPATAMSWKEQGMMSLARNPRVHCVVAHQCAYGLTTPDRDGNPAPAMKPTRFITLSSQMAAQMSRRCSTTHKHQQLVSGRCAAAPYCPLGLVRAILRGMQHTTVAEQHAFDRHNGERQLVNAITMASGAIPMVAQATTTRLTSEVSFTSGETCKVRYSEDNFKSKHIDEYTGEILDPELTRAAIIDDLDYLNSKVWQIERVSDIYKQEDDAKTRSRWVTCSKGDSETPDVGCRLVSCETNEHEGDKPPEFYASTPPLEAQRMMLSRFAS